MSETPTKTLAQRLLSVMKAVDYIQKERKEGMRYTIVSHDAVTAKVRPELVKEGVIYYPVKTSRSQDGNRTEMDVTVRFVSVDDRDDYIDVQTCGYGVDTQDKGPGKAMSYAVKYALLKALGLETGDDPDEAQGKEADYIPKPKNSWVTESIELISKFTKTQQIETWRAANLDTFNTLKNADRDAARLLSSAVQAAIARLSEKTEGDSDVE